MMSQLFFVLKFRSRQACSHRDLQKTTTASSLTACRNAWNVYVHGEIRMPASIVRQQMVAYGLAFSGTCACFAHEMSWASHSSAAFRSPVRR